MRSTALLVLSLALAAADSPAALLQRMKAWLEPTQPSTRQLQMTVRSGGEAVEWTAGQARAPGAGGARVLTVLLAPPALRGTALLVEERAGQPPRQWLYLPHLRRVRELLPGEAFEPFLGTELSYADLGVVPAPAGATLLGEERLGEQAAVKVEERPAGSGRVARVVTWLVPASGQPLRREYHDRADRLWKVETFEAVAAIHGIPTVQRVRVEDVQTGDGSEYRATRIAYGLPLPAELFDPARLPQAADSPVWK